MCTNRRPFQTAKEQRFSTFDVVNKPEEWVADGLYSVIAAWAPSRRTVRVRRRRDGPPPWRRRGVMPVRLHYRACDSVRRGRTVLSGELLTAMLSIELLTVF